MSDIDWMKPVEYEWLGVVVAVAHTFVLDGDRYVVLPDTTFGVKLGGYDLHDIIDMMGTFRNVPEAGLEPEPEPPAIDWMKPVEYLEQHEGWLPVVASYVGFNELRLCVVKYPTGEHMYRYTSRGEQFRNVQRKVRWQRWVNLYPNGISCAYESKEHADKYADEHRLECRLIEWESVSIDE